MQARVNNRIKDLIAQRMHKDSTQIIPQSRLSEDLGMQVITFARLMKDVADEYRINISKEEMKKIETVGDLQASVEKHLTH